MGRRLFAFVLAAAVVCSVATVVHSDPAVCTDDWITIRCTDLDETGGSRAAYCEQGAPCRGGCVRTFKQNKDVCMPNFERFAERVKTCCHKCNAQYCR